MSQIIAESTLPTTEAEAKFYSDELLKCGGRWDAQHLSYFLFNYAYTKDEREGTIKLFPDYPFVRRKLIPNFFNPQGSDYLKSRQMLVSWFFAAGFVWEADFFDAWTDIIRSQGLKEAQELKGRCQFVYDRLPPWMQGELEYQNMTEMVWKHRYTRIISVHSGRSYTGHRVLVDEAAHIPEGAKVNEELGPTADAKGIVDKVTTPNGEEELFFPSWHNESNGRAKITLHWSEHPHRDEKWKVDTKRKLNLTDVQWNREYELSFATPAGDPVYPVYGQHNKVEIEPKEYLPLIFGLDPGFPQGAVWCQYDEYGKFFVYEEAVGDHKEDDIGDFGRYCRTVTERLFPFHWRKFLSLPTEQRNQVHWGDGDPMLGHKTDVSKLTRYQMFAAQYPIIINWCQKFALDAIPLLYKKMIPQQDGQPLFYVHPRCKRLITGLEGGYSYPPKKEGRAYDRSPIKDGKYDMVQNALEFVVNNEITEIKSDFEIADKRRVATQPHFNEVTGEYEGESYRRIG